MDDIDMYELKPIPQLKIRNEITSKHSHYGISTVNLNIEPNGKVNFENETPEVHIVDEITDCIKKKISSVTKQETYDNPETPAINFRNAIPQNTKLVKSTNVHMELKRKVEQLNGPL